MTEYNIPDDFMNFSNEIYEPLSQVLLEEHERVRAHEKAKAGIHGLMGFFHEHGRNNLERMGIDGWMGNNENPDRDQVKREIIGDVTHVLNHFIDEAPAHLHPNDRNDLRLAESIRDRLLGTFGIPAEGRKKPKKHRRHRTRRNGLKHKGTKHKGTKHKGTKHKRSKHKRSKH